MRMCYLFLIICLSACVVDIPTNLLNNKPINVPEFAGFGFNTDQKVFVINLLSGKKIGELNVVYTERREYEDYTELMEGIFYGEDCNLYVPVGYIYTDQGEKEGKIVRVINPENGNVVKEIEVSPRPHSIYPVEKRYIIILHDLYPTDVYTLIDTKEGRVVKEKELPSCGKIFIDDKKKAFCFMYKGNNLWELTKFDPINLEIIKSYPITKETGYVAPRFVGVKDGFVFYFDGYTMVKSDTNGNEIERIGFYDYPEDGKIIEDKIWVYGYSENEMKYRVSVVDLNNFRIIKTMDIVKVYGVVLTTPIIYSSKLRRVFIYNSAFDVDSLKPLYTLDIAISTIKE